MNKSARELSQPVSVESPGSRASTVSSLSFDDYDDQTEETQESSWATYTDDVDRQQQDKIFICGSFNNEKREYGRTDLELSSFAKKLRDRCGKNILINGKIVQMKKREEEMDDTACSPHSSPTVSYMNQLHMMKLKNNSNAQEKMVMQGKKPVQKTEINSNKERSELEKRGLCIVPLSSVHFKLDKV